VLRLRSKLVIFVAASLLVMGGAVLLGIRNPAEDSVEERPDFPLRTDPLPKEWNLSQINDGLPHREERSVVHVLAWEVIETDQPSKYTQILVLGPTVEGGHTWVLAHLYHHPDDNNWPWRGPKRIPPPYGRDEKVPQLTDTQLFGFEFYNDLPNDNEIETFLKQTRWTPILGSRQVFFFSSGERTITTRLTAGGINPVLWEKLFHREVAMNLFPELKKTGPGEQ
jgi:hypothetical protein